MALGLISLKQVQNSVALPISLSSSSQVVGNLPVANLNGGINSGPNSVFVGSGQYGAWTSLTGVTGFFLNWGSLTGLIQNQPDLSVQLSNRAVQSGAYTGYLFDAYITGIGAVSTDGFVLNNPATGSPTIGAQWSPRTRWNSNDYNSTTKVGISNDFILENQAGGGGAGEGNFVLSYRSGNMAFWPIFALSMGDISNGVPIPQVGFGGFNNSDAQVTIEVPNGASTQAALGITSSGLLNGSNTYSFDKTMGTLGLNSAGQGGIQMMGFTQTGAGAASTSALRFTAFQGYSGYNIAAPLEFDGEQGNGAAGIGKVVNTNQLLVVFKNRTINAAGICGDGTFSGASGITWNYGDYGGGTTWPAYVGDTANGIRAINITCAAVSDIRIKDIINAPQTKALSKILSIPAKEGFYKQEYRDKYPTLPESRQLFLIAQDVEKEIPDAIKIGNPPENLKSIDNQVLIPYLFGAIQELAAKVEKLEHEVKRQKTKLDLMDAEFV